jgi:hypothetical protein
LWYDGQDFVCEKWSAKTYCKRGVGSAKHQLRCHPEVKRVFCSFGNVLQVVTNSPCVEPIEVQAQEPPLEPKFGRIVYPQPAQKSIAQAGKTSPAVSVEQVQEVIEVQAQEPPLESKFGRIVYPQPAQKSIAQAAKTSPAVSVEQVQEAITQAAENIPGVEVDRVQEPIIETVETSPAVSVEQVQEAIEVQAQEQPLESKFGRIVYPQPAQKSIAQEAETAPSVEVDRAEEPIMETAKTSPGVDLDDELPECSNCFGDGYVEDEFGSVKFCPCETEPRLSHQRTQRAIAPTAKNSLKPSDLNPILTGIALSDRFLARYAPPQSETLHYELTDGCKVDTNGQLSLFEVRRVTEPEPPDPDDFESLDAFREAIARWDAQNPEPYAVSIDSMCEWAPCPQEWYEPEAEILPLKASSTIELPEKSEVMELSITAGSSSTSDFFIPTFGHWGDRSNGTDEPPDTWIFARLPKPKPPTFPPQAATSWTQVGHKLSTSWTPQVSPSQSDTPKLSRNYPETIPKLFHCIAAGSITQPARSPPGGDAMS